VVQSLEHSKTELATTAS